MNEENRNRINWYDILSKIIFLIIIILILLWFFPRGGNSTNTKDDVNNKLNSIQSNLSVLLDKVFRDNLNEMKAAAKAYFTKDRMPTEDGASIRLSLQEMYDQNMLLPLIDKEGNACSASKSYVKVTKTGDKYKLKVSLTCGGETKSVVETIGCYDFCEDGSCKKGTIATRLQYQFVREIETTKYSCPSGYMLKGKYCYSENFGERIDAEEIWKEEYEKTTDAERIEGGEYKTCKAADEKQDDTSYSCPDGYTLNGKKCEKTETTPATQGYSYTCPSGYTKNGNYCYKTTTVNATANYAYKCPSGYSKSGTKCGRTTSSKVSNGYTGWKYVKSYSTATYSRAYVGSTSRLDYMGSYKGYSCSNHSRCPRKITYYSYRYYTRSVKYVTKYTTTYINATKYVSSYSCASGYTKSGSKCTKNTVVPTTRVDGAYSCPDGYALNGKTCYKTTDTPATEVPGEKHYSCEEGYTLEDNKCCKTVKSDDTYYCPDLSAKLEGNKCVITVPASIIGYKCPDGYIKDGKTCYTKSQVKQRATSKTVISYQYKWSYFKSLRGWTRTGKTRSV